MKLNITGSKEYKKSKEIPEGQLFHAMAVGTGGPGIYLKYDGACWPVGSNGRMSLPGNRYNSPECPVVGYDPIEFV